MGRIVSSGLDVPILRSAQVGCRTRIAESLNAGITTMMSGRAEFARDDITALTLVYGNFYTTSTGEAAPGGVRNLTADIEYPAGTFTRVTWDGGATGVALADGVAQKASDAIAVTIPKGAQFWINTFQQSAAGIIYYGSVMSSAVLLDHSVLTTADLTGTVWAGSYGGVNYGPYAVLANTRLPAVAVVGDSRACNAGGTSAFGVYGGEISPAIAPFFPVLDLSRGSQAASNWESGGGAKRAGYLDYVSHAVAQIGINDVINGRTAAQIAASRQAIRALKPSLKWFQTTLAPRSTSTDSWATLTNQTTGALNSVRQAVNEQVRGGAAGFLGHFDTADAVESGRNSGILKAPPMTAAAITADGVHVNDTGYGLQRPAINPAVFVR